MTLALPTRRLVARLLLVLPVLIGFGWLGVGVGEALGYLIAHLAGRDPAELKGMLIWCVVSGAAVTALFGIWLLLVLTGAGPPTRRAMLVTLFIAVLAGASILVATYDRPKDSGIPVIEYELRLPSGMPEPAWQDVALDAWTGRFGHGIRVAEVRRAGDRPEIAGSFALSPENPPTSLSLRLPGLAEGHWRPPIDGPFRREEAFGPWQPITFLPQVPHRSPLPAGEYDIRYRVRRFM